MRRRIRGDIRQTYKVYHRGRAHIVEDSSLVGRVTGCVQVILFPHSPGSVLKGKTLHHRSTWTAGKLCVRHVYIMQKQVFFCLWRLSPSQILKMPSKSRCYANKYAEFRFPVPRKISKRSGLFGIRRIRQQIRRYIVGYFNPVGKRRTGGTRLSFVGGSGTDYSSVTI